MKNTISITMRAAAAALVLAGCVPSVEMPGVLEPVNDPKWKQCADDLAARQEQAMLDDLMLDNQRLVCQAVVAAAEGDVNKSMELFAEAAVIDKKDHRPHYLAGRILADVGRYDEAVTAFERSHERYPALEIPTERLGRSLKKAKGAEDAAAFLQRAADRKLCNYGCRSLLAQTYHELKKDVFAKPIYEQMTAEEPWEPGAFVGLAGLSNAEGDFVKEIFYLGKAIATKHFKDLSAKQQAAIYYSLAFAKYNSKDYAGAERIIDEAVGLDPKRADWHLLAGWIAMKQDKAARALTSFEAAKDIDGNLAAIHEGVGDAQKALGNIKDARTAYNFAHQIDRGNALVTLKLAHVAALDEDYDIAKRLYDEAAGGAGKAGLPQDLVKAVSDLLAKKAKTKPDNPEDLIP